MPKLTKRKALQICYELFTWLAENPGKHKKEWPGWIKYGYMQNNCPCCEYQIRNYIKHQCSCIRCPLLKFWSSFEKRENRVGCYPCEKFNTPWISWLCESNKLNKDETILECNARQIANAAKDEINKLPPLKRRKGK
jgi:hypothetical protein